MTLHMLYSSALTMTGGGIVSEMRKDRLSSQ